MTDIQEQMAVSSYSSYGAGRIIDDLYLAGTFTVSAYAGTSANMLGNGVFTTLFMEHIQNDILRKCLHALDF